VTAAEEETLKRLAERVVQAAARVTTRTALDLVYLDPHDWSDKPCATCRIISGILGFEHGCDRYRSEKSGKASLQ